MWPSAADVLTLLVGVLLRGWQASFSPLATLQLPLRQPRINCTSRAGLLLVVVVSVVAVIATERSEAATREAASRRGGFKTSAVDDYTG